MIGIDIEENARFKGWSEKQLTRIFTKSEREYADKQAHPEKHFCGFFCVKEALVKALNNTSLEYKKIEILHTDTNKPYIKMSPYVQSLIKTLNAHNLVTKYDSIEVSISHSEHYSTAVVQIN